MDTPKLKQNATRAQWLLLATPLLGLHIVLRGLQEPACQEYCDSRIADFQRYDFDWVEGVYLPEGNIQAMEELARQIKRCPKAKTYTVRFGIKYSNSTPKVRFEYNHEQETLRTVSYYVLEDEAWIWQKVKDAHITALADASETTTALKKYGCIFRKDRVPPTSEQLLKLNQK